MGEYVGVWSVTLSEVGVEVGIIEDGADTGLFDAVGSCVSIVPFVVPSGVIVHSPT